MAGVSVLGGASWERAGLWGVRADELWLSPGFLRDPRREPGAGTSKTGLGLGSQPRSRCLPPEACANAGRYTALTQGPVVSPDLNVICSPAAARGGAQATGGGGQAMGGGAWAVGGGAWAAGGGTPAAGGGAQAAAWNSGSWVNPLNSGNGAFGGRHLSPTTCW